MALPRLSPWPSVRLPWPRFRKPPLRSRTVGFPESGSDPGLIPQAPSQPGWSSSAGPHPPLPTLVYARIRPNASSPARCPGLVGQPGAQGPFAPSGRYPSGDGVPRHLGRRYPPLFATTGPCASPKPSPRLWLCRLGRRVFAGCCQSRLGVGLSRRYLCGSFPACLDPYPGCSCGAFTRSFPQDIGLPHVRTRSALGTHSAQRLQARARISGLQHSFTFRPAGLLATQVAPTAVPPSETGQPWLLLPGTPQFVTSLCPGYASRPNRAIDGGGLDFG